MFRVWRWSFVLVLMGLALAGCDDAEVFIAPEMRLHFWYQGHCETIRVFWPGIHDIGLLDAADIARILQNKGVWITSSQGTFRVRGKIHVAGRMVTEATWERYDVLTNRWLPVQPPPLMSRALAIWSDLIQKDMFDPEAIAELGRETLTADYYYRTRANLLEYWAHRCAPSPTPHPTASVLWPTATPSAPPWDVAVTPSSTPRASRRPPGSSPTAPPSHQAEVIFYTRLLEYNPCTQVRFRFSTRAEGEPDLTRFVVTYHGLQYRITFSAADLQFLDEAFSKVSPTQFTQWLRERMKVEIPAWDGVLR